MKLKASPGDFFSFGALDIHFYRTGGKPANLDGMNALRPITSPTRIRREESLDI